MHTATQTTRDQLLLASLQSFGNRDFDAVSTREIVDLAGANIASISYHFGGKRALYLATAEYLADSIQAKLAPTLGRIEQRNRGESTTDCQGLLQELVVALTHEVLEGELSAAAAGFIFREQLNPTAAFDILYQRLMEPMHRLYSELLSALLQIPAESPYLKMVTHTLLGQIIIFRVGQTTIWRRLECDHFTPEQIEQISHIIVTQTIAAVAAHQQQGIPA